MLLRGNGQLVHNFCSEAKLYFCDTVGLIYQSLHCILGLWDTLILHLIVLSIETVMCKSPAPILYFSIISDAGSSQIQPDPQTSEFCLCRSKGGYWTVVLLRSALLSCHHSLNNAAEQLFTRAYTVLGSLRSHMITMTVYGQVCTDLPKAEFYIGAWAVTP